MKNILIFSIATLALAACSNSNSNNNGDNNDNKEELTYTITYAGGESGFDNFLFYDLIVAYKDVNGKTVEIPVVEYPFEVTISDVKAPFTAELTPTYKMKPLEEIENNKETFRICSSNLHISYESSNGQFLQTEFDRENITLPLEKAYAFIQTKVERLNEKTIILEIK